MEIKTLYFSVNLTKDSNDFKKISYTNSFKKEDGEVIYDDIEYTQFLTNNFIRINYTEPVYFVNNIKIEDIHISNPKNTNKFLKGIKIKSQLLEDTGFEPLPIKKTLLNYFFDSYREVSKKTLIFPQPIQKLLYFDFYITDLNDNVLTKNEIIDVYDLFFIEFSITYSRKMSENDIKL